MLSQTSVRIKVLRMPLTQSNKLRNKLVFSGSGLILSQEKSPSTTLEDHLTLTSKHLCRTWEIKSLPMASGILQLLFNSMLKLSLIQSIHQLDSHNTCTQSQQKIHGLQLLKTIQSTTSVSIETSLTLPEVSPKLRRL